MNRNDIDNYIEKQCVLYGLQNVKIAHQKGFYLFKKDHPKAQCWAWYGEASEGGRFRLDFIIFIKEKSVQDSAFQKIKQVVGNRYDVLVRANYRFYFIHDLDFTLANFEILGEAMLNYLKFFNHDFPKIDKILATL